jgi:hypothetical protein
MKTKLRTLMIAVLVVSLGIAALAPVSAQENHAALIGDVGNLSFSGGRGTPESPYLLSTARDLIDFAGAGDSYSGASYRLTANIDLSDYAWEYGSSKESSFNGTLDGNGKAITLRTIAPSGKMGFLKSLGSEGVIKNLTIKASVNQSVTMPASARPNYTSAIEKQEVAAGKADRDANKAHSALNIIGFRSNADITIADPSGTNPGSPSDEFYFGLIAARSEGIIENCLTEGSVNLTVSGATILYAGGAVGRATDHTVASVMNKAGIAVKAPNSGEVYVGGIAGEVSRHTDLRDVTNQGAVAVTCEWSNSGDSKPKERSYVGGIAGFAGFGARLQNLLNTGRVSTLVTRAQKGNTSSTGGIAGTLWDGSMNQALNRGAVYAECAAAASQSELRVAGIAGSSGNAALKNIGSEASVEGRGSNYMDVIGVTRTDGGTTVNNAYVTGRIRGQSPDRRADIYVMGLGEQLPTNNFYFAGTTSMNAGGLGEISVEALANIRPGETTGIYNYCYWNSRLIPFPGYPGLTKATATSKPVDVTTGRLGSAVSVGGQSYGSLSDALNAWVAAQGGGYLRWTGAANPAFDWTFGYELPDSVKYRNRKEGKWLDTSDWAYEWMERADALDIIPAMLLNKDMTQQINRREFAAVAVALYENMSGDRVEARGDSPFRDTNDSTVLKAYELGIVAGKTADLFGPEDALTREQAATMLARVYKAVYWEGWTLRDDAVYDAYALDASGVGEFGDHRQISSYARGSVYFMTKKQIIDGTGNNRFSPQAMASREQAFKIAVATIGQLKR